VVILHEFSHGLAAILTGGQVNRIEINANQGGVCYYSGGFHFLIISAGYLGSIVWGGIILLIASRTNKDRILAQVVATILLLVTLLYIRNLFGFFFTLGFSLTLFVISKKASEKFVDLLMKFLGLTSCLYVVVDIKSDLIDRSISCSDASVIAKNLGFPQLSIVVGIAWMIFALIILYYILKKSTA
jgi:hypothetical protein